MQPKVSLIIGWWIAFDKAASWSFGNDFAWNVVVFNVDNTSSPYTISWKKKCFALGDEPTDDINYSPSATEKKMSINFTKVN